MTTTPMRPKTAYSGYLRMMTRVEQEIMARTLQRRKRWVRPHGTSDMVREVALLRLQEEMYQDAYCVCSL